MPIFDQGYQHWKGPLSSHVWRWLAVARQGVRTGLRSRIVRLLLLVAWIPALALIIVLALWGLLEQRVESVFGFLSQMLPAGVIAEPKDFRSAVWTIAYVYFFKAELICTLFLVLIVGPNLISKDLRFNALPLYFSRPLRRTDYFFGKLGVIGFFLAATVLVPAVTAYALGIAFSLDLTVLRDTYRILWASLAFGLVIVVSAGTLMLALSALSRRTIYVGLAWVAFWFISATLSGILIGIRMEVTRHEIMQKQLAAWVQQNPPPPGIDLYQGMYPAIRNPAIHRPVRPGDPALSPEEEAQRAWFQQWQRAQGRMWAEAEAINQVEGRDDWRPLLSYPTNLDRVGEELLDYDSAWVTFGRATERPRAAMGPLARGAARGAGLAELGGEEAVNERRLADRMAWQYPWYWSAGVLAGLVLVSAGVMTRQVKSLDRLK
jgi:ABC-type transport system involved in multi-copper enzyme maturation permease subunit